MFITTKLTMNTAGEIEREGFAYSGPVARACGGPSQSEKDLASAQASFYTTMRSQQAQMFAGASDILSSLKSAATPILAAGPGQYGFSPAEDAAFRSQATSGTAGAYQQAARATGAAMAARGGGNSFLPSGGVDQIQQEVANAAAGQESAQQLGITQAGYAQGNANYNQAASVLGGAAQTYNPTGYASQATGAGSAAFNSAQTIWQQQQQSNQMLGSIIGGAASLALGAATGGASLAFPGMSPGMISGAFGGPTSVPTSTSSLPDFIT